MVSSANQDPLRAISIGELVACRDEMRFVNLANFGRNLGLTILDASVWAGKREVRY